MYLELPQPLLPVVGLLLIESEIDKVSVAVLRRVKLEHMTRHVGEILLRVGRGTRSQTL